MNNEETYGRERAKSLFIVEGEHERDKFLNYLFLSFPEMGIDLENSNKVCVYGTHIYQLYDDIVQEYGKDWMEEDVDLPFVIGKKKGKKESKINYTDIVMVFDYEQHDPKFGEEKIKQLQKHFSDSTDMGKLYINYPMRESYLHLKNCWDREYLERKQYIQSEDDKEGKRYKDCVKDESGISQYFELYQRIEEHLIGKIEIRKSDAKKFLEKIFAIHSKELLMEDVEKVINDYVSDCSKSQNLKYYLKKKLSQSRHIQKGMSYWDFMRELFQNIVFRNIEKANKIQFHINEIQNDKSCFERLDLFEILKIQNEARKQEEPYICILNTSVFLIPDYKFDLLNTSMKI